MSLYAFSLTAEQVRAHMFPRWPVFSARSSPTDTIVGEIIIEQAGELTGKLYAENITAASITDSNTAAFQWCVRTLKLMCALAILRASTMQDPELAKAYAAELKQRLDNLAAQGGTALGDDSLNTATSDPDGPTTHISQFGLTTDDADDMSTTVPRLRRDDAL